MRILVLTSTFPRWRDDREPPFVFELCRRLAAVHEVCVLAPHCRGAAVREEFAPGVHVRRFRYAPASLETLAYEGGMLESVRRAPWRYLLLPFFLLGELVAAMKAVRELRPDVVHAHWIVPQGLVAGLACALSGRAAPVVCTSHGADLFALRGGLASRAKAWALRRAAALTVVSSAMKPEAIRLGANPERLHVMPMGVDARERFTPGPGARNGEEILFVGRLVEKKGVAHLLEALARVRQARPRAILTVAGSGPLEASLRERSRALGIAEAVRFAGPIPNADLPAFYRRAAVLAMPSVVARDGDREGLGLVLAEALACECPVVASDLP
ncbi:MAG: glycosyltransferase, partial [Clostridia bacterium]